MEKEERMVLRNFSQAGQDVFVALVLDGQQGGKLIARRRGGTHCGRRQSGGAGNQRFQSARGTRGIRETGNQGTLSYGYSREHGGTGNDRAGGEVCRREERRGAVDERGQEKTAD